MITERQIRQALTDASLQLTRMSNNLNNMGRSPEAALAEFLNGKAVIEADPMKRLKAAQKLKAALKPTKKGKKK